MTFSIQDTLFTSIAVLFLTLILPVSANAQNQSTTTFNYESSTLPYNWVTTAWSSCSGECNEGNQSRTVSCQDNAGNSAPSEANCSHSAKPDLTRGCDLADCQWVAGVCPSHVHDSAATSDSNDDRHTHDSNGDGFADNSNGEGTEVP